MLLDFFYAAPKFRRRIRKSIFEVGKPAVNRSVLSQRSKF
jgi:hypothetical protein